ncbi:MAG: TrmH family RNA methyltransferase [Ilumatobacteraceae bacterium]
MPELIPVDDPDDERLAVFRLNERQLSSRPQRRNDDGEGLFMAEGDLVVERALAAGCEPVVALVDELRPPPVTAVLVSRIPVYAGGDRVRALVTKLGVPNSVVALFRRPPRSSVAALAASATRLVLVEAVDNPANIGAIIRNATGLGWDGLIVDATSADPWPDARSGCRWDMRSCSRTPAPRRAATVADLVASGFVVAALTPAAGARDIDAVDPPDRLVVCLGAERVGLSDAVQAAATLRVRIPMHHGVDSLNVAAASAIACHALRVR